MRTDIYSGDEFYAFDGRLWIRASGRSAFDAGGSVGKAAFYLAVEWEEDCGQFEGVGTAEALPESAMRMLNWGQYLEIRDLAEEAQDYRHLLHGAEEAP